MRATFLPPDTTKMHSPSTNKSIELSSALLSQKEGDTQGGDQVRRIG